VEDDKPETTLLVQFLKVLSRLDKCVMLQPREYWHVKIDHFDCIFATIMVSYFAHDFHAISLFSLTISRCQILCRCTADLNLSTALKKA
jgi:hypothetical protein